MNGPWQSLSRSLDAGFQPIRLSSTRPLNFFTLRVFFHHFSAIFVHSLPYCCELDWLILNMDICLLKHVEVNRLLISPSWWPWPTSFPLELIKVANCLMHGTTYLPWLTFWLPLLPFVSRLNVVTASFLAYTIKPPVASEGLGLQEFDAQAVASFVIPLACSILFAAQGFLAHHSDTLLPTPPTLARGLLEWESSTSPLFINFRTLGPALLLANEH